MNAEHFTVRDARPGDAPAIRRIINAAYLVERTFVTGDRINDRDIEHCFATGHFLVAARGDEPPAATVFRAMSVLYCVGVASWDSVVLPSANVVSRSSR